MLSEGEIRTVLAREEGQFLEFKSLWNRDVRPPKTLPRRKVRDSIAEYVAAFANADGGTLFLGVEDDGDPTGHAYPEEEIGKFLDVPNKRLRPPVRVGTQRTRLDGNEVVIFEVPATPEAIMFEGNGFPYRVGDSVIHEPQEVINERKQAYRRVGYEQRVRQEASLNDVDLDLAGTSLVRSLGSDRTAQELLERYGLVIPSRASPAITHAALLLFTKPPLSRWHPRAGVRFFRVNGTERLHGTKRNVAQLGRIELPIITVISEAHRFIGAQIRRSEKLYDLFFRELPEYPTFAWQEALVNAFAHRDYAVQGREIEVWFFDDRMEVLSPGGLIPPVTLAALRSRRSVHASRNPLLARVLVDCGIMREEGEGIPRMFEAMEESFLQVPTLAVDQGTFRVTLRNQPIFKGPSPEWQHVVNHLPLATSQKRVLMAHPDGFTNERYRKLNAVDRDQAYREIQEMVALGVVTPPEAPGRGAKYRLSPDLRRARAWLGARLPKIRSFFDTKPYLKNADYREMFAVTRTAALQELRLLVEERFLRAEGERRGARYSPGPNLGVNGGSP